MLNVKLHRKVTHKNFNQLMEMPAESPLQRFVRLKKGIEHHLVQLEAVVSCTKMSDEDGLGEEN